MRGKVPGICKDLERVGITPAYAGKRLYYSCALATLEDHPRMCGEKQRVHCIHRDAEGSPPHVRGKVYDITKVDDGKGITPACAGKRPASADHN